MGTRTYRERLIEEVRRCPVLYDTRHESHRDMDSRDQCWLAIATKLGINSEVLKREWKILRDSMRQALKRSRGSTKAGLPCKKWRFESKMAFLLPYMTVRRSHKPVKEDIKLDEGGEPSEPESEPWEPPSSADQDSLDLFFASVCQSTKRLPKKLQNKVKRQVLDVLLKVEEEFETEQNDTKADFNKSF